MWLVFLVEQFQDGHVQYGADVHEHGGSAPAPEYDIPYEGGDDFDDYIVTTEAPQPLQGQAPLYGQGPAPLQGQGPAPLQGPGAPQFRRRY